MFFQLIPDLLKLKEFSNAPQCEVIEILKLEKTRSISSSKVRYNYKFKYVYSVDGSNYTSESPTVYRSQTLNGIFEGRIYDRIKESQSKSTHIFCYVNPDNPSDAVLDNSSSTPTLLVNLLLIIGPISIGVFALYCAFYEWKKQHQQIKKEAEQAGAHQPATR